MIISMSKPIRLIMRKFVVITDIFLRSFRKFEANAVQVISRYNFYQYLIDKVFIGFQQYYAYFERHFIILNNGLQLWTGFNWLTSL